MDKIIDWLAWVFRPRETLGGLDSFDERDWNPSELFGVAEGFPKRIVKKKEDVDLFNMYAFDQGGTQSCTSQGSTGVLQTMLQRGQDFDSTGDNFVGMLNSFPFELWKDQKIKYEGTDGTADIARGDYLHNAMKTLKHRGVSILADGKKVIVKIKGYSRISTNEVDEWLERGHPVFTGCKWILGKVNGRYRSFDDNGYLFSEGKEIGGHAFFIVGKTEIGADSDGGSVMQYKIQNSHGTRWGSHKDGTAFMTYEKLRGGFSKYIFNIDWEYLKKQLKNSAFRDKEVNYYYST